MRIVLFIAYLVLFPIFAMAQSEQRTDKLIEQVDKIKDVIGKAHAAELDYTKCTLNAAVEYSTLKEQPDIIVMAAMGKCFEERANFRKIIRTSKTFTPDGAKGIIQDTDDDIKILAMRMILEKRIK